MLTKVIDLLLMKLSRNVEMKLKRTAMVNTNNWINNK